MHARRRRHRTTTLLTATAAAMLATAGPALAAEERADGLLDTSPTALWFGLIVTLGAALAAGIVLTWHAKRVLASDDEREDKLHRLRRAGLVVQFVGPLAIVVALIVTRAIAWPLALVELVAPDWEPPTTVAALFAMVGFLLPMLALVVVTALVLTPRDRELRGSELTTRSGVGLTVRAVLVPLVPLLVWFSLQPLIRDNGVAAFAVALPVFLVAAVVFGPLLINLALNTRRFPDGPVRERILALCDDAGLRVRDVRCIDTRGGKVANAAISGVVPQLRYVYVSDHMVELLDGDELDAVVAHEIAHGKGHHVLLKVLAGFGAIAVTAVLGVWAVATMASRLDGEPPIYLFLLFPILMVGILLLVHGVLGVRLEKRADDHAVERVGAEPLHAALEKMADANGLKRRTGWFWNVLQQHPGMEQRLERLREEPVGAT